MWKKRERPKFILLNFSGPLCFLKGADREGGQEEEEEKEEEEEEKV